LVNILGELLLPLSAQELLVYVVYVVVKKQSIATLPPCQLFIKSHGRAGMNF
jgi:hypothetical protein